MRNPTLHRKLEREHPLGKVVLKVLSAEIWALAAANRSRVVRLAMPDLCTREQDGQEMFVKQSHAQLTAVAYLNVVLTAAMLGRKSSAREGAVSGT